MASNHDHRGQALVVERLSKTFPGTRALDDVSLALTRGRVHALIGGNGSGKSTLIKVLAGVHQGDPGGRIAVDRAEIASERISPAWAREVGLRFVHQDLGLFDDLSVTENVFAGARLPGRAGLVRWADARRMAKATLERLGLDLSANVLVASLRPSERALVAVARALHDCETDERRIVVLDEPTASLPAAEVETVLDVVRRLAAEGHALVYVSHRLEEILAIADEVLALRDGELAGWTDARGLTERQLVEMIAGRPLDRVYPTMPEPRAGAPVLEIDGLHGGPIRGVSFSAQPGEVLGVAGLAGSGRTTLLRLLFGARRREAGSVRVDGVAVAPVRPRDAMRAGIGYLPEDRSSEGGFFDMSLRENLSAADMARYSTGWGLRLRQERRDAVQDVRRFSIRAPSVSTPLSLLSGGNQQKVLLARWLRRRARVLLLDEPSRGVDVAARADIYQAIRASMAEGACAIVVSSDFEELARVSDRVLVLARGRFVAEAAQPHLDRHWLEEHVHHVEGVAR